MKIDPRVLAHAVCSMKSCSDALHAAYDFLSYLDDSSELFHSESVRCHEVMAQLEVAIQHFDPVFVGGSHQS